MKTWQKRKTNLISELKMFYHTLDLYLDQARVLLSWTLILLREWDVEEQWGAAQCVCQSCLSVCLSALRHLSVSLKPLSSCWAASSSIHLMSYSNTATHAVRCVQHIITLSYILCRSDAHIKTQDTAREQLEKN